MQDINKNLETLNKRGTDLELESVEALLEKFTLINNRSKRTNAVVNVETDKDCFKYALHEVLSRALCAVVVLTCTNV